MSQDLTIDLIWILSLDRNQIDSWSDLELVQYVALLSQCDSLLNLFFLKCEEIYSHNNQCAYHHDIVV